MAAPPEPTVVLVTGPPATGKSTLAEFAASRLSAPVLAWDWVMAALTPFEEIQGGLRAMDESRYRLVGWALLWQLTTAQVRGGRSVVLDGVARRGEIATTRQVANDLCVRSVVVATMCSDLDLHRQRVEGRERNIPGWHELDWGHVQAVVEGWEVPTDVDLHLDAVRPLEANLADLGGLL